MEAAKGAGVLAPILAASELRLRALRRESSEERLWEVARAAPPPRSLRESLSAPGVSVIAELKRRSPSAGELRPGLDCSRLAAEFADAGAAALSVLTEPDHFGGSLADLRRARESTQLPVLRKDFVVAREQVLEARASAADAVLLIVRALADGVLGDCLWTCRELGVDALVEVHDQADMDRAAALGAGLIGINNRDLDTLRTDLATTERLAAKAPAGAVLISESGISGPADLERLRSCGVAAVLVGETLMRSPDPAARLGELVRAGVLPGGPG